MENILSTLERFLKRYHVSQVQFAQGRLPPPELAYHVNFPRVAVILAGSEEIEVETNGRAQTLQLTRGQALVIPPNCWDRPHWTGRGSVLNLLFGKKQTGISLVTHDRWSAVPPVGQKQSLRVAPSDAVHDILRALMHSDDRAAPTPILTQALLLSIVDLLKKPATERVRKAAVTYEAISLYVQANFAFPISRDSVAAHFHLSPNHISRLFLHEGLMGFTDFLNRVRIDRAKFLLRNHPLALDAVAFKSGYRDVAYFCRVFKKLTKLTPTEYREQKPLPPQ